MDFDDLLAYWLKILEDPVICQKYSQNYKYILVDEYQDTNRLQFEIIKKLCSHHKNILAVGDDAQSVYSFRGAEINNLLDFPKTFEGTKIFKLEINYRSTPKVLHMANQIIKHNLKQFPKTLRAIKTGGDLPAVIKAKDVYQQAKFVGQRILELNREGIPLSEIAVLFRSRFQAMEMEVELLKRSIPYILRGGVRFFEQAHIKDVLSYLRTTANPKDELSFKRALALHKGIGRSYAYRTWEKIKEGVPYAQIETDLPKRQKDGFKDFSRIIESLKDLDTPEKALRETIKNYKEYCYLTFDNPDERLQELDELTKMAHNYNSTKNFLADLGSLEEFKGESRTEASNKEETLVLSTIHQAKGLEWETVFIIGFSDYEFPSQKSLASEEAMEEERRLFYVATTRAKSRLYITYPETKYTHKNGLILSRPSSFYYELPHASYEEWNIQGPEEY
jgi:DNA helicase-2/ATP-dependent DNA helicase PcrA